MVTLTWLRTVSPDIHRRRYTRAPSAQPRVHQSRNLLERPSRRRIIMHCVFVSITEPVECPLLQYKAMITIVPTHQYSSIINYNTGKQNTCCYSNCRGPVVRLHILRSFVYYVIISGRPNYRIPLYH